ncbi:unnamed protein product [Didymodactylos carnosus]|uniref:Ubiquitin carboxyl-terminal hydrolase n=1 Tax=Didymodactylos carnosus TaxID=1234261 RepID=A0A813RML8_9BILA|nr:unnamed protein product [Didymodactylos carnosus]CAF3566963.1 unnamed protein product [Didymodactylos carnosus]
MKAQPKLPIRGNTGLYNLGNTCYVNCVLQLLSHVPQICDAICSMSFESLGLEQPSDVPTTASLSHEHPPKLKGGSRSLLKTLETQAMRVPCYLAYELHGIFNILWSGKCQTFSPLSIVTAIRNLLPCFEPCAMEDAQEFLEALLSAITEEIKINKLADTNIISHLLGFSSESQILCEQCHRISITNTDETFITLTFSEKMLCDSRGSSRRRSCHLTEMLSQFHQWEALSTPFQCSQCAIRNSSKEGTRAQKRLLISKLPQVLHLVLRRFRSLPKTNLRRQTSRQASLSHKITLHVNFDEYLDMAPYCCPTSHSQNMNNSNTRQNGKRTFFTNPQSQQTIPPQENINSNNCQYRLRGVIVHYGKSINTGHFVSFCYNDAIGEWIRCDDHVVETTTFESVKTADAYILVYSRCATAISSTMNSVVDSHLFQKCNINTLISQPQQNPVRSSRKRRRALSVDNVNDVNTVIEKRTTTVIDKQQQSIKQCTELTLKKQPNQMVVQPQLTEAFVVNSLKSLCVNMDPGLRRRTQSLNFPSRRHSYNVDSSRESNDTVIGPPPSKRRQKISTVKAHSPIHNYCSTRVTSRSKSSSSTTQNNNTSQLVTTPVTTRKKPNLSKNIPNSLMTDTVPAIPKKATRRRKRRALLFSRKRRPRKTTTLPEPPTQTVITTATNAIKKIGKVQTIIPSSIVHNSSTISLIKQTQQPLAPKRLGRVRIQRSIEKIRTATPVGVSSSITPTILSQLVTPNTAYLLPSRLSVVEQPSSGNIIKSPPFYCTINPSSNIVVTSTSSSIIANLFTARHRSIKQEPLPSTVSQISTTAVSSLTHS